MKKCPTCNRTYDDETISFCLDDGSLLSAPEKPLPDDVTVPIVQLNRSMREIKVIKTQKPWYDQESPTIVRKVRRRKGSRITNLGEANLVVDAYVKIANILELMANPPNYSEDDLHVGYFDGGTVHYITGCTEYKFSDGTRASVSPALHFPLRVISPDVFLCTITGNGNGWNKERLAYALSLVASFWDPSYESKYGSGSNLLDDIIGNTQDGYHYGFVEEPIYVVEKLREVKRNGDFDLEPQFLEVRFEDVKAPESDLVTIEVQMAHPGEPWVA